MLEDDGAALNFLLKWFLLFTNLFIVTQTFGKDAVILQIIISEEFHLRNGKKPSMLYCNIIPPWHVNT